MPTESITPANTVPAPVAIAAYQASTPPPVPALTLPEVALADALREKAETLEELALQGDRLAIAELVREHHEQAFPPSPVAAQHPSHAPGAAEPGKGQMIDEYD